MIRTVLWASFCALAYAGNVTYNVISLDPSGHVAVIVDDTIYKLQPSAVTPVLYTGTAPVAQNGYQYARLDGDDIIDQESFIRQVANGDTTNEFYNRTFNVQELPQLPKILDDVPIIDRMKSRLHIDGVIATFHFSADQSEIERMHNDTLKNVKVITDLTYIRNDDIETIPGVELYLSGRSSRWFSKVSYNVKIPKGYSLFGYRRLKLRSLATDPSYIREQLGYDVLRSVGLPATQFSFARVGINGQPLGLFGLIEAYKNPWLKNEFADGKKYTPGILYQGGSPSLEGMLYSPPADLAFHGYNASDYVNFRISEGPKKSKGEPDFTPLIELAEFIDDAPTEGSDAAAVWDEELDTEIVIRNMVIEILLGFADGYIVSSNNYFLYDNPDDDRFVYLPSDLDMTMGSTFLDFAPMLSGNYEDYPGFLERPLLKLLWVPEFRHQFEKLLLKVCEELLNPEVLNSRIDALIDLVREDVEWDKTLPRLNDRFDWKYIFDIVSKHPNMAPAYDNGTNHQFITRVFSESVSLDEAVNGPTTHESLMSIKEWFAMKIDATVTFLKTYSYDL
ncbi:coth protein-domain-containing protein [Radiomyces spectabilis]|uniref:coth protein-domain-containing protein n=1 Tax=Radiomyces spectabilis TaxID=64574 RepID=UPI00221E6CD9|nr:coth protein-domain-containing protein [Radiomyces spectabilis]KAI8372910.1 coth protein-domain-containing protein [Radiomyces spectabilis]